jgi:hypothetical protein
MRLISHRGNINGRKPNLENTLEYIDTAIESGYAVEIDAWEQGTKLYLGHDKGEIEVSLDWLLDRNNYLYIHCKNFQALSYLIDHDLDIFYHEKEDYTIMSNGLIWAHNIDMVDELCIIPLLDKKDIENWKERLVYGVCSDYIELLK